jgi:hypothetical protein
MEIEKENLISIDDKNNTFVNFMKEHTQCIELKNYLEIIINIK